MSTIEKISPVYSRIFPLIVDHGKGSYLIDTQGRRYLDFTCGIGVTNTGHAHPQVVKAIQDQAAKLIHGQANIVYHQPMVQLIDELGGLIPPALDSFFFSNSGAEIVEAGVKLAKNATGRPNVIVFKGSFHGRTHLTMAMTTSKTIYRAGYQPLVPGIFVAPYPYSFSYGWDDQTMLDYSLNELKKLLKSQTAPEETACIVVEPVLGEGGYVVPPAGFLPALRKLCDEHGILLIADEIQSGAGRTGKFFAIEHTQTVPDVLLMAKGLASGLPLSCLATRQELAARWKTGSHGGTYGGNVVACAAAVATIQVMREEGLIENASQRGAQLMAGLLNLQSSFLQIGEVRGLGLMIGVEFGRPGAPDPDTTKVVKQAAYNRGLMLLTCGTFDNVIRWIPPLTTTEEEIDQALSIFAASLDATIL
ncbi:MAG: aminotransferase class III-fold pyridoxal phosphate-dependent enzyme [Anaerolineales bacterium]|nr:aminotransferase class III-fold pyridoxal phosphate-dependent enzyme [Anaerolineales bacterium]